MTNKNTKSHNLCKKVSLLHDGVENDFIKKNTIKCPHCDGIVEFDLYSSSDFNKFDKSTQQTIAKDIKGLKADSRGIDELTYKGEFVGFCTKVCSCGEHTLMIFFTFSEIQPARYISHLIGVFDADYISSI